jgi:hypothetical protein
MIRGQWREMEGGQMNNVMFVNIYMSAQVCNFFDQHGYAGIKGRKRKSV